jgi:ferric-dicitrate binding protein FerR (iron transport regulator)
MPSSLEYLLNRYANKTCTPEEKEELMRLLQESGNDEAVQQLIDKMIVERQVTHRMPEHNAQAVLQAIFEADEAPVVPIETAPVRRIPFGRIAAAAIIVLLVTAVGWLWLMRSPKTQVATVEATKNDVAPGGNKALLSLADGSTIVLDNAANGIVAQEGNANVVKLKNGQLMYTKADDQSGTVSADNNLPVTYNTLTTPRGGEYKIVLPDGSTVWLNAASSITYPTVFEGKERKVQVTGEAYFEVAKVTVASGKRVPFIVDIINKTRGDNQGQVEVLGTHFNINAYDDEKAVKTTLLEGKVKVNQSAIDNGQLAKTKSQEVVLSPGEQAVLKPHSPLTTNHSPDINQVMAWKNGLFHFENADMKTVMRQLSRWYDVEVVYKNNKENADPLFFEVKRNTNLSDVLKVLNLAGGARFSIENKKIIVQ